MSMLDPLPLLAPRPPEAPAGRTVQDDADAFGAVLDAFTARDGARPAPGQAEAWPQPEAASAEPDRDPSAAHPARPAGGEAPAASIAALLAASAGFAAPPAPGPATSDDARPAGTTVGMSPPVRPETEPPGLIPRITVLARETHFAPVMPVGAKAPEVHETGAAVPDRPSATLGDPPSAPQVPPAAPATSQATPPAVRKAGVAVPHAQANEAGAAMLSAPLRAFERAAAAPVALRPLQETPAAWSPPQAAGESPLAAPKAPSGAPETPTEAPLAALDQAPAARGSSRPATTAPPPAVPKVPSAAPDAPSPAPMAAAEESGPAHHPASPDSGLVTPHGQALSQAATAVARPAAAAAETAARPAPGSGGAGSAASPAPRAEPAALPATGATPDKTAEATPAERPIRPGDASASEGSGSTPPARAVPTEPRGGPGQPSSPVAAAAAPPRSIGEPLPQAGLPPPAASPHSPQEGSSPAHAAGRSVSGAVPTERESPRGREAAGEAGPPAPAPLPEAAQAGTPPAPPARPAEPALASATLPALVRSLAAQMPPTGLVPGAGPLRILTLQLHPADLGAVTVRMRLRDGDLEMNLGASRAETAELLRKDAGVLTDLLRGSGYRPEILTIQAEPRAEAGTRTPAFADAPPQGGSGADHPARRGPQDHAGERTPSSRDTSDDPAPSLAPRSSGVYL
ncbi:hypothetical protein GMJLKIPL_1224 [Methylobacterium isbiliense]|uniref:Flagellar hook-length control protein-like C-terminal domain-containing protein n=3 Tax=Methylobacterium isbiliense TaxID=315478 RepID=A0ABQ4S7Z6_9HYPH|nr:hypothetical protein GMJLKIPL_1224 [Methylobacterium isbiliense]